MTKLCRITFNTYIEPNSVRITCISYKKNNEIYFKFLEILVKTF